jgi:hypothetical protein
LWWAITPDDRVTIDALRQKIQSKMTVISVVAGFAAAMLTTVAVNLAGPDVEETLNRLLLLLASLFFAAATGLLILALFAYDQLMMPPRFWSTRRRPRDPDPLRFWPVARPPSSAGWVLYQHAVRIWRLVIFALAVIGVGCVLMMVAALRLHPTVPCTEWSRAVSALPWQTRLWLVVGVGAIGGGVMLGLWCLLRPKLGTED